MVLREDQEALQIKNNWLEKEFHDLSSKYEMVLQHIQVFEDQFASYELWIPTNPSDGAGAKAEPYVYGFSENSHEKQYL